MKFEWLANELLLDLLEYLDTNDLFHAFSNLNGRFNELLFTHCQFRGTLNFQSISKTNFDRICREYLPRNLHRITSIHLSDHDETPDQINLFLSDHFQLPQLINLKSLSLSYLSSESVIMTLHELPHLTRLKMSQCCINHESMNNGRIFDQIWSLNSLTHCYFQLKKYLWNPFFISPQMVSRSIKSLYLEGFSYNSQELHNLFFNTINLENLTIDIEYNYDYQEISTNMHSLKRLKILVQHSPYITNNFLHYTPNLIDLTIELTYLVIDGYQWEILISNYLPNLRKFQMKMEFHFREQEKKEEEVDQLLNSFRNPFWIDQHQWFIQCHWYVTKKPKAYLYTLPYNAKEFSLISEMQFKSTCPNNEMHWSVIPNCNRLKSLHIRSSKEMDSVIQLENLVQKTAGLCSLTLTGETFADEVFSHLRNSSVRRLHLYDFGCFNEEQCQHFMSCPLAIQCEVLFITVNKRSSILHLVERLKNLRALNIRSQDDAWKKDDEEVSIEDELVNWLKDRLPRTCLIKRGYVLCRGCVQLWIG